MIDPRTRYFDGIQNKIQESDIKNTQVANGDLYGMGANIKREAQPRSSTTMHMINFGHTIKPNSLNEGDFWFDVDAKKLLFYTGGHLYSLDMTLIY